MRETADIIRDLGKSIENGEDVALATIISTKGSTPRGITSKMLVYPDAKIQGTVGGGAIEALVIKKAIECLKKGESGKFDFDLTAKGNTDMICSGKAEIFIEVYKKTFRIVVLGAGHVSLKLSEAFDVAGYSYIIVDDREEYANEERFSNASKVLVEQPYKALDKLKVDGNTYIVIITRGHSSDKECLAAAMKSKAAYIGMIGSKSKVAKTFEDLKKKKMDPLKDERVFSPIGLNLGGETPGEIAISVLSQIMAVHYKKDAKNMRINQELHKQLNSK
ncbi:MAG: XdhC family protein [Elusimicrobiales bacterium]|nr:XdhC family protein [Elusimicrobiales bacterium]